MTDNNLISVPEEISKSIKSGMEHGGAIQLPFSAPFLYVVNGNARFKTAAGVSYFGGWATDQETMDEVLKETGQELPKYFAKEEMSSSEGKPLSVYTSRFVVCAPIAFRESWVIEKNRYPEFREGARRHVQMISYLADSWIEGEKGKRQRVYAPWGPVVLTAKGYQAKNILDAFGAWVHMTKDVRRVVAPDVPAYFFNACLGTFGDEPKFERVGKGNQTSSITPIELYQPSTMDAAVIKRLFVGEAVYAIMADCKEQAKEWLVAWKEQSLDMLNRSKPEQLSSMNEEAEQEIPF